MANFVRITFPGRWVARLAALLNGGPAAGPSASCDQGQGQDAHPSTMQTIERVSAGYQEKLGLSALHFAGEFQRRW